MCQDSESHIAFSSNCTISEIANRPPCTIVSGEDGGNNRGAQKEKLQLCYGWFGSNCQYLCHCDSSGSCDVNGQCSTKCASGWFGLNCQYQDLATVPGVTLSTTPVQTTPTWLTDSDDLTCNVDQNIRSLRILWNTTYPFTWMRVKLADSSRTEY
ncbi:hypothetical protein Btru_059354 [Bulinus truncatus]|nr:hypothetical protein Btru_059354 [Bulinus truncatus]